MVALLVIIKQMAPPQSHNNPIEKYADQLVTSLNNLLDSLDENGMITSPDFTIRRESRQTSTRPTLDSLFI